MDSNRARPLSNQ